MPDEITPDATPEVAANEQPGAQVEQELSPESSPETKDSEGKETSGFQKRIDELTRDKYDALRQADYWKVQAEAATKPQPKPEEVRPEAPKTLADFDYDESSYYAYVRDEARQTAINAAKEELRADALRRQREDAEKSFHEKIAEGRKAHEDFDYVIQNQSLPYTQSMHDVVVNMDHGHEVLYYLGKNPEISGRISQLPPGLQGVELARIEARLAVPKDNLVSKAPPPPATIQAASQIDDVKADHPDSDRLSADEWMKRRNKQIRSK